MTCGQQSADERIWVRGSEEYLEYDVTVDVELDVQPVQFTLDRIDYIDAMWDGVGTWNTAHTKFTRRARTVDVVTDADLPDGVDIALVFAKVTDNPEISLFPAGSIIFV